MWRVDDSFIHGCVFYHWICRLDVSVIPFIVCLFSFFHHRFWPCRCRFLSFPCLWEIHFSSQMIIGTVSWLLDLDKVSGDRMIILAVRRRSWRELDSWSFGDGLF